MSRTLWGTLAVVGLTTATGFGIWFWPRRESAELHEVKQLQAEMRQTMFAPPAEAKDIPPEERRAKFDELRQKMEALPEADRKQAEHAMRQGFAKQMEQKLATFFALPPEEQTAALDKDIDEQEARRKTWGGGPFGPPPGATPAGAPDRVAGGTGAASAAAASGQNSAPGAADGRAGNRPFGPPRNLQNMSAEDRKQMQRDMLDSTTPEFRAQMSEYIKKIRTRRQERGLPNFGPPA